MSSYILKTGAKTPGGLAEAFSVTGDGAVRVSSNADRYGFANKVLEPVPEGFVGARGVFGNPILSSTHLLSDDNPVYLALYGECVLLAKEEKVYKFDPDFNIIKELTVGSTIVNIVADYPEGLFYIVLRNTILKVDAKTFKLITDAVFPVTHNLSLPTSVRTTKLAESFESNIVLVVNSMFVSINKTTGDVVSKPTHDLERGDFYELEDFNNYETRSQSATSTASISPEGYIQLDIGRINLLVDEDLKVVHSKKIVIGSGAVFELTAENDAPYLHIINASVRLLNGSTSLIIETLPVSRILDEGVTLLKNTAQYVEHNTLICRTSAGDLVCFSIEEADLRLNWTIKLPTNINTNNIDIKYSSEGFIVLALPKRVFFIGNELQYIGSRMVYPKA